VAKRSLAVRSTTGFVEALIPSASTKGPSGCFDCQGQEEETLSELNIRLHPRSISLQGATVD
jgi:hypothetical protein